VQNGHLRVKRSRYGGTGTFIMICLPREAAQAVGGLHEITDPDGNLWPARG